MGYDIREKFSIKNVLIIVGSLLVLAIVGATSFTLASNAASKKITNLQNEIARRDTTIEVQKNVYTKLAMNMQNVMSTLDMTIAENKRLDEELRKRKAEVLSAQTLTVQWKKAYEAAIKGNQTEEIPGRKKIEFEKDFGYIVVKGHTITDPPEAFIRVSQGRALRLSLVLTQEHDRSWRSYVTSSEENIAVDISISAVNPRMLDPKWYEKIGLHADIGLGSGFLVGVGASYKIGKFTVGPTVWGAMNWDLSPKGYVGLTFGWNPFQRD